MKLILFQKSMYALGPWLVSWIISIVNITELIDSITNYTVYGEMLGSNAWIITIATWDKYSIARD